MSELPAATTMGAVHLTVSDLARSLDYYQRTFGLEPGERAEAGVSLSAGTRELVVLVEEPGAQPVFGHTGLYHFAMRVPERAALARWLSHAARSQVPLVGLSDHFVSEAIYLSDPDGHGIEIYCDRPRELWEGQVAARMTTEPLDVQSLLGELDDPAAAFDGVPAGTVMGHVHFRVASIPDAIRFYRDVVGLGLMASYGEQAAFLGAGGYHHHVGGNTWESRGATPPPPGSAALRHATMVLPSREERDALVGRLAAAGVESVATPGGPLVRDPSGNGLVLAA